MEWGTYLNSLFVLVFILILIYALTWVLKRVNHSKMLHGRKSGKRVTVVDVAVLDGKRKLILVRRDDVEHLLLIGGPTDVIVESGINKSGDIRPNHDAEGA